MEIGDLRAYLQGRLDVIDETERELRKLPIQNAMRLALLRERQDAFKDVMKLIREY